jgi:hypothetical protein
MAGDLRCFLDDRPIRTRRVSPAERLGRWCRRNKVLAGLTGTTVLLLGPITCSALKSARSLVGPYAVVAVLLKSPKRAFMTRWTRIIGSWNDGRRRKKTSARL